MRKYGLVALAAATLALSPAHAAEQSLASDVLACAAQPDEKAQLGCYNAIAARLKAAQATAAQTPKTEGGTWYNPSSWFGSTQPPPARAAGRPPAAQFGSETLPENPTTEPPRLDEITVKVASASYNYFRRFTVTLDNGQVWRQLESDTSVARFGDEGGESVTIKRGWMGFVLSLNGKWYQVKRIK